MCIRDSVITARFAIYRNNVMHSLSQALAQRFPVVQRLVGAEFFAAMAAEFIRAHPPASPVLLLWGGDFAGFLSHFPPVRALPYLPDVARIEHARGQSYHAADIRPLDGAALGAAMGGDAGRLRFALSPSITFSNQDAGGLGASVLGWGGGLLGGVLGAVSANLKFKEASTLLTLVDNRSGVQLAAAEGSARNTDVGALNKYLATQGMHISDGYGDLKGKTFRIAHMADASEADMLALFAAINTFLDKA